MRDFNLKIYSSLLNELKSSSFEFYPYKEFYAQNPGSQAVVLRHDVDARKENSLAFAKIQHAMGIRGTYYFRMIPASYDETIIREMNEMGHEIGYHYETMDSSKGDIEKAYNEFCRHLESFRKLVPVSTICMHGSPLSKFDNRAIWSKYDYRKLGIVAEPYFDLDFNKVFYITDTGRRWNGASVSIRDKAMAENPCTNEAFKKLNYRSTFDIIKSIKNNTFPSVVMMTFHPQRWTDNKSQWYQELLLQNTKNIVKSVLVKLKQHKGNQHFSVK